jgi:phosphopantetheinyl transferase (holo-ACP synthase)
LKKNWHRVLGNDIVDLKQAAKESDWQRKGLLNKIYTPLEQELILAADCPAAVVWLIWTMKEASYKAVNRITGLRSYAPLSYVCSGLAINGTQATASVTVDSYRLFIKAQISEEIVHSSAVLQEEQLEQLRIHYLSNSAAYVDEFNQCCPEYLLFKNPEGLPLITHLPTSTTGAASVSHHGSYAAIVYAEHLYSGSPRSAD